MDYPYLTPNRGGNKSKTGSRMAGAWSSALGPWGPFWWPQVAPMGEWLSALGLNTFQLCATQLKSVKASLSLTLRAYPELAGGLCSLCQRARELWKVLWWQHTPTLPDRPGHMLLTNHRGHRCKPSKSLEWDRTRIIWQRALTILFHKIITYYLENYRLSLANVCLLTSHKLGNTLNSE